MEENAAEKPVKTPSATQRSHRPKYVVTAHGKSYKTPEKAPDGVLRRGSFTGVEPKTGYNTQVERIQSESERLWGMIDVKDDNDACWPWLGSRMIKHGVKTYGQFDLHNSLGLIGAHRAVFADYHGYLPEVVRHSCDNPPCCNPGHLIGGSEEDNRRDMMARGRQVRGSMSASSKLTEDQVIQLRKDLGSMNVSAIARKYGISRKMVRLIREGVNWKHV